jgi:hypothetical protein
MVCCKECSAKYIGKTKRKLITRLSEHRTALKGKGFSYIANHSLETGHVIDWEDVSIIDYDNSDLRLLYKETLYIRDLKPSLNNYASSIMLNVFK